MKILARNLIGLTAAIALTAPVICLGASAAPATSPNPSPNTAATAANPADLDTQLDSIFTNTFQNFGNWFNQSKLAASFDLRDQKDKYVARIYLPNGQDTSKVNARVKDGALDITAQGEETENGAASANRFEQILSLPGPVQADKMQVERKQNLVVVTLPKATTATAQTAPSTAAAANNQAPDVTAWNQSIIDQMARMQGRMDQMMQDAFPQDFAGNGTATNLGSAVNVSDQKDKYVVHFYLPDRNLADVNVKLNHQQLDLTAKEKSNKQNANSDLASSEHYEQMITLPGPVKDKGMKVNRNDETIVVTVPKAS